MIRKSKFIEDQDDHDEDDDDHVKDCFICKPYSPIISLSCFPDDSKQN